MSRAFVKEDASGEDVTIPARAPLPPGTPNYVTSRGLKLLQTERDELLGELARLEQEGGAALALVQGKLELLEDRLSSANLVEPIQGQLNIGARVTLLAGNQERHLTIVGVDEADLQTGRIAFTAPIAQALLGHKVGDSVALETAKGTQTLRIMNFVYEA